MRPTSDWRSAQTAEKLLQLDRSEIAIEFLRRNPAYREDYRRVHEDIASNRIPRTLALTELATRWGLTFPASARHTCLGAPSDMEARIFTFGGYSGADARFIRSRTQRFHR